MYTPPGQVDSPRTSLSGPIDVLYDAGRGGFAVAKFNWNNEPAVGIRWNGSETHPGMPQSRGLPTWFVVPGELEAALLRALLPLDQAGEGSALEKIQKLLQERKEKMSLKDRVIELKQRFISQHQLVPEVVAFTPVEEYEIERMGRSEIGEIVGQITVNGARVLQSFLGLQIQWDAGNLAVLGGGRKMDE